MNPLGSRNLNRVFALTFVASLVPIVSYAQDSTAPVLQSMSFTPTAIDVSSSAQTLTLDGRMTDDLSGVNYGCLRFQSPSGLQYRSGCMQDPWDRLSGDDKDGIYRNSTSATFPQFSEAGTWHVDTAWVYDKIGNSRFYTEAELIAAGFPTTLQVTSAQDSTAPMLQSLSYTPTPIDVSNGAQTLTLDGRMTDDLAGVNYGCIRFQSPSGLQYRSGCMQDPWDRLSGDDKDGIYRNSTSATFPQFSEAGTWHVDTAWVYDKIGNSRFYSEGELVAAGFPTTLQVVSNPSDVLPPSLLNLSFTPSVINTAIGDRTLTLNGRMTDDLSGVNYGCIRFQSPSGLQYRSGCMQDPWDRLSGDDKDGIYRNSTSATFPQFSEAGTWHVDTAWVYDKIGNSRFYTEADLIAAGSPTTLRVTASQVPTANAGPDQNLEATGTLTQVALDGSASSDPDPGDTLAFEWRDAANTVVGNTAIVNVMAPVGSNTYTLTVDDGNGSQASDTVVINVNDSIPPIVAVTRPNGGEKLFAGTPFLIEWTASDNGVLSFFDVFYSINAGVTFNPVPGCSNVNGVLRVCTWNSPGPNTTTARIRVRATDGNGNTGSDFSNANFSIVSGSGSISVTAPNTAVDLGAGSVHQIKYNHNLGVNSYVRIELSRDARETWEVISPSFKNTGATSSTFNWPVTLPRVEAAARVRVTWINGPTVGDMSNVDFTISPAYLAVTTPTTTASNQGYGTTRKATWTTNLSLLDKVDVLMSTDGGVTFPHPLASNITATTKTANYTTPTLSTGTDMGRIRVVLTSNPGVNGTSPVDFPVQPAYIKVTQPNLARDGWTVGSNATIKWANNLAASENVKIELSLDGGANYAIIVPSTPSDGSHTVNVQAGWATATARVRITWLENATVSDASAESFVIQ